MTSLLIDGPIISPFFDSENETYLFECYIAELRRWRIMKLLEMEKTINDMCQKELGRRIKAPPPIA